MNKIVELIVNMEEFEFEDLGVEILSLVDKPAIEVNWMAFAKELEFRENPDCPDGWEHHMPDGSWMCGKTMGYVDNTGFEKFETFFNANLDLFKKPGVGAAGDGGVNHADQMKMLNEAGINTEYPFGYCFQVAQFLFYATGGYSGDYALKCIKGMHYQVDGVDFASTHWYIQHKDNNTIVDLTASQFEGLLDINDYYASGRNANLGYPYYNVGDDRVEFDETVPSFQTLKLYSKWREDNKEIPVLEDYYAKAKYEELRKEFTEESFAISTNEVDDQLSTYHEYVLRVARSSGYPFNAEDVIYVDGTKQGFETISDFLQGARALDALGDLPTNTPAREVFRYTGPAGERGFCRVMMAVNRVYTEDEITLMNNFNSSFGHNKQGYSIFEYGGGPNCQHYFERLIQYQSGGKSVLVSMGPAVGNAGKTNNRNYKSPTGAVANNGYYFNSNKTWSFSDDDKMIVTGPAMIANQLIARKDEMGNLFHVYFSKETIATIAKKFLADNNAHNTDINHNGEVTNENTLLESWIVDDPKMDKSTALGFNVPEGTWMTSMKINNRDTWNKIKAGELNGFSVEGSFLEVLQKN